MTGQAGGARGRPREAAVNEAIQQATLEILEEQGYSALTIAAVAARAGVSKPTIYLRWPSKVPLVVDAMARLMDFSPIPDTGTLRGDLLIVLKTMIGSLSRAASGRILEGLLSDLHRHPDLAASFRERYFEPRWLALKQVLARARSRGELHFEADFDVITDALIGPIYYRLLVRGEDPTFELEEQVVDFVLAGLKVEPRGAKQSVKVAARPKRTAIRKKVSRAPRNKRSRK